MVVVVLSVNPKYITLTPPASVLHYRVECITR